MIHLYRMIFIFLMLLIYLDWRERNTQKPLKEKYCNKMDNSFNRTFNQYTTQNKYTTDGSNPFIKCPQCSLHFDCSNYPYEVDDVYKTLCTTCIDKNNDKFKVLSRQPGRPRKCSYL